MFGHSDVYYNYSIYVQYISSLYMTGLPCFLRRGNRRNYLSLSYCAFAITIIVWKFYIWGSMFTIIYVQCISSLYMTGLPCFLKRRNWRRNRRNWFCLGTLMCTIIIVYMYSIYHHCIWLVYLAFLGEGTGGIGLFWVIVLLP